MSLSGNLEDVSVADALQFIHLGGRTGTLTLSRGETTAEIGFHQGRIFNAWGPGSKRLGDLLLDNESISQETLDQALREQERETPRRSLGQILVTMGALTAEAMYTAVQQQIERTVYDLVTWTSGTFHFALDDLKPIDDISVFPGDIVGHLRLDTQAVLLDALRVPLALAEAGEYQAAVAAFERDWFAPLLDALRAGRAGMVSIHVPDAAECLAYETIRGDLRRFWRRPKRLEHYA